MSFHLDPTSNQSLGPLFTRPAEQPVSSYKTHKADCVTPTETPQCLSLLLVKKQNSFLGAKGLALPLLLNLSLPLTPVAFTVIFFMFLFLELFSSLDHFVNGSFYLELSA